MQLADATLRPLITASIRAAWPDVKAVHHDDPEIPAKASGLPRAYLSLQGAEPQYGAGAAAARDVTLTHSYQITLQAQRPSTGTVADVRAARVQALLDELVPEGSVRYQGYRRRVTSIVVEPGETEASEPVYYVSVAFEVDVVTGG